MPVGTDPGRAIVLNAVCKQTEKEGEKASLDSLALVFQAQTPTKAKFTCIGTIKSNGKRKGCKLL